MAKPTIEDFPDEILDMIIGAVGWRADMCLGIDDMTTAGEESWPACALVCRRWHRITLPHLHQRTRIVRSQHNRALEDSSFVSRLAEIPPIAQAIQELIIGWACFGMSALNSLLDLLPHLRRLVFDQSRIIGDYSRAKGHHKLDNLEWRRSKVVGTHDVPDNTVVQLFLLFSEIGHLQVFEEGDSRMTNSFSLRELLRKNPAGEVRIGKLTLDCLNTISFHVYLALLPELNMLQHLTRLTCKCNEENYMIGNLNRLLKMVGHQLRELTLHFDVFRDPHRDDEHNFSPGILNSGFTACTNLHGFEISITSLECIPDSEPYPSNAQITVEGWKAAFDILPLVPTTKLKHLTFRYWCNIWCGSAPSDAAEYPALPWADLCRVLRRFKDVESIEVTFDEAEERQMPGAESFLREMQEFGDVLFSGDLGMTRVCEEGSCRWYQQRQR